MSETPLVRQLGAADAPVVASMMDAAFRTDPVSMWLYPAAADRDRLHPAFFRMHVDMALRHGRGWATTDLTAAMLWYDVRAGPPDAVPSDEPQTRFAAKLDPYHAERVAVFEELTAAAHPHHQAHAYLPFVAVAAHRQGQGTGTSLLRHRLTELDRAGVPAYLEASTERNTVLYERLGFQAFGAPIRLPGGPALYPMWRVPRT